MRHIKLFESADGPIEFTVVTFCPDDEPTMALYIDGFLEFYGDGYHDDIDSKINGFLLAIKWIVKSYTYPLKYKVKRIDCNNSELNSKIGELGNSPPKELKHLIGDISEELLNIRALRYKDEFDADEIRILVSKKQYSNLKFLNKRGDKREYIKEYTFEIKNYDKLDSPHKIRVVLENFLHPKIKTPGTTYYTIYKDGETLDCSRKIAKEIFSLLEKNPSAN